MDGFFFFFQPTYGRPNSFPDPQIEEKCTDFIFSSTFECLELELNHVSKFHVRTLKIERGTAILVKSWPLWPAQLVLVTRIITLLACLLIVLYETGGSVRGFEPVGVSVVGIVVGVQRSTSSSVARELVRFSS